MFGEDEEAEATAWRDDPRWEKLLTTQPGSIEQSLARLAVAAERLASAAERCAHIGEGLVEVAHILLGAPGLRR